MVVAAAVVAAVAACRQNLDHTADCGTVDLAGASVNRACKAHLDKSGQ